MREKVERDEKSYKQVHDSSLCWMCQRAVGDAPMCRWARDFEPMPGWEIKPDELRKNRDPKAVFVEYCPKFFPDEKVYGAAVYAANTLQFQKLIRVDYSQIPMERCEKIRGIILGMKDVLEAIGFDAYKGLKKLRQYKEGATGSWNPEEKLRIPKPPAKMPKTNNICKMTSCVYAQTSEFKGKKRMVGCNYLYITGECRSTFGRNKVDENGRCAKYKRGKKKKSDVWNKMA